MRIEMKMKDIEKSCRCKFAKLSYKNGKRTTVTTVCIECRLKNDVTDPKHCAKCKERKEGKK